MSQGSSFGAVWPSIISLFMSNFALKLDIFCSAFEQVSLSYEDGRPVEGKGAGRKVIDKVKETYDSELNGKDFAYDGEKTLFTVGSLARNKLEFTVVLEDVTSNRLNCMWLLILQIGLHIIVSAM